MIAWPHIAIMREVAEKHGLTLAELRDGSRRADRMTARMEAARRLSTERGLSASIIGRLLGNRSVWSIRLLLNEDERARRNSVRRMARFSVARRSPKSLSTR